MDSSTISEPMAARGDTPLRVLKASSPNQMPGMPTYNQQTESRPQKRKVHSMQEFHPTNKKMILSGKCKRSKLSIPRIKSSRACVSDSNTTERVSRGFWSKGKQEHSKRLWWPIKTDWHASRPKSSNGSSRVQAPLSAFSLMSNCHPNKSLLRTSWQSYTYSLAGSTGKESTPPLTNKEKKQRKLLYQNLSPIEKQKIRTQLNLERDPKFTRAKAYQLKLTPQQHRLLLRWFADARKTYNLALGYVLAHGLHKYTPNSENINFNELTTMLVKQFVSVKNMSLMKRRYVLLRTLRLLDSRL